MDTMQAIGSRRSRRCYLNEPIPDREYQALKNLATDYNRRSGLQIHLIREGGEAFKSLRRSYGMFSGVHSYFAMIGNSTDLCLNEKIGYYGELLVLEALKRGLGSCWVGGTFDKNACPCEPGPGQVLECVITVGLCPEEMGLKESAIYHLAHRGTKPVQRMFRAEGEVPDWFLNGAKAVQKAPSGMNRQPVFLTWHDGKATIEVPDYASHQSIDLGIAKVHFELAAGGGQWKLGNGAEFCR